MLHCSVPCTLWNHLYLCKMLLTLKSPLPHTAGRALHQLPIRFEEVEMLGWAMGKEAQRSFIRTDLPMPRPS